MIHDDILTPDQVGQFSPVALILAVSECVQMVDVLLRAQVNELMGQGWTDIYSSTYYPPWSMFHPDVVDRFRDLGWQIDRMPDFEREVMGDGPITRKVYRCPRYRFALPGGKLYDADKEKP